MTYHLWIHDKESDPHQEGEIEAHLKAGAITLQTHCRTPEENEWKTVGDYFRVTVKRKLTQADRKAKMRVIAEAMFVRG